MDETGGTKRKSKRRERKTHAWEKVEMKEDTEQYMDMQTGALSLQNPESESDWEMFKPTYTGKVAYYCAEKRGRNGVPCAQYYPPVISGTWAHRDCRQNCTTHLGCTTVNIATRMSIRQSLGDGHIAISAQEKLPNRQRNMKIRRREQSHQVRAKKRAKKKKERETESRCSLRAITVKR